MRRERFEMPAYKVLIDDNFHFSDPNERTRHGDSPTPVQAVEACKAVVNRSLVEQFEPGMPSAVLWAAYQGFAEDPFVLPDVGFSAWEYAKARAGKMTA
jgi:hypothetical protein